MGMVCSHINYLAIDKKKKDWKEFEDAIAAEMSLLNKEHTLYGKAINISNVARKLICISLYFFVCLLSCGLLPIFDYFQSASREAAIKSLNDKAAHIAKDVLEHMGKETLDKVV